MSTAAQTLDKTHALRAAGENSARTLRRQLLWVAVLALGMMCGIYLLRGNWPFGGATVLTGDLNNQYVPYFAHYKRAFLGDAGFAYGFDKSLGGDLVGLFAYYVASPLNLAYVLAPVSAYPAVAALLLAAKVALACVCCAWYLLKKYPLPGIWAAALSLGYGFSAFNFVYAQNIMWHDVVVLLPLLCMGIERVVHGKGFGLYTAALTVAIFANFYIAFIVCIFAVLYFLWAMAGGPFTFSAKAWRQRALRFFGGSAVAGGLGAALLLPSVANASASKGSLFTYTFEALANFPLRRLPERFVWGNFAWHDVVDGLPEVYCGLLVLLLAACYFAARGIPRRQKLLSGGVVLVLLLSFWVRGLDTIWHGFKTPVWFPYRYSFLLCFFLVVLAGAAVAEGALGRRALAIGGGVVAAFFVFVLLFPVAVSRSKTALSLGTLLFFAGCLWLWVKKGTKPRLKQLCAVAVLAVAALEMGMSGYYIMDQFENYPYSDYRAFIETAGGTADAIQAADPGDYRLEKSFWRTLNDPMLLGYWGISHFGSTKDTESVTILDNLGYRNLGSYLYGSTAFADSVLGIRYAYTDGTRPLPSHYVPSSIEAPLPVSQNPTALPLVFAIPANDAALAAGEMEPMADTFRWQNELYESLGGEGALFVPYEAALYAADGTPLPGGEVPAGAAYRATAPAAGTYYALIDSPLHPYAMLVNGEAAGVYFDSTYAGVIDFGHFEAGETITLSWDTADSFPVNGAYFYYLPEGAFAAFAARANQNGGSFAVADGRVAGAIAVEEDSLLFTSIPFAAGWRATVNGQPVETARLMGGFLAVPLAAGENTVALTYHTPQGTAGMAISLSAAALLAAFLLWRRRRRAAAPMPAAQQPASTTEATTPQPADTPQPDDADWHSLKPSHTERKGTP